MKKRLTKHDQHILARLQNMRARPGVEMVFNEHIEDGRPGVIVSVRKAYALADYQPVVPGSMFLMDDGTFSYLFFTGPLGKQFSEDMSKTTKAMAKPLTLDEMVAAAHAVGAKISFGLEPKDCCFPDHKKFQHCGKPATVLFKCTAKHAGHLLCNEHLPAAKKLYAKWPEWSCAPL